MNCFRIIKMVVFVYFLFFNLINQSQANDSCKSVFLKKSTDPRSDLFPILKDPFFAFAIRNWATNSMVDLNDYSLKVGRLLNSTSIGVVSKKNKYMMDSNTDWNTKISTEIQLSTVFSHADEITLVFEDGSYFPLNHFGTPQKLTDQLAVLFNDGSILIIMNILDPRSVEVSQNGYSLDFKAPRQTQPQ